MAKGASSLHCFTFMTIACLVLVESPHNKAKAQSNEVEPWDLALGSLVDPWMTKWGYNAAIVFSAFCKDICTNIQHQKFPILLP